MNIHLQRLWDNIDKLILLVLLIITLFIHIHMVSALGNSIDPGEASQINWLENIIGQLLAAMLTLLVAQVRQQQKEAKSAESQKTD